MEILHNAYETGKDINVIYTDEKVFDKEDHVLLLEKQHKIVTSGRILESIQSYLNGRSPRIRIQGGFSDEKPVSSGFP